MPTVGQLEYLTAIKLELIKHTENKITSVVLASIQMAENRAAWRPSPGHVLCLFAQVSWKMGYLPPLMYSILNFDIGKV